MVTVRAFTLVLLLAALSGCALNERTYWAVSDPEVYWHRAGFDIKPPAGRDWYKQPTDDTFPNSIIFSKGGGVYLGGGLNEWIYMNGATSLAMSTVLDDPVPDRTEKSQIAAVLRGHLDRYRMFMPTRITKSSYESFQGLDCIEYFGMPAKERQETVRGDVRAGNIMGYFCLHPKDDRFGVVMESRDVAFVGNEFIHADKQVDHFFRSLRFTPISTAVSRTFATNSYRVGRSPSQLALYKGKFWVAVRDEDRVVQVDPSDGAVVASLPVGRSPVALVIGNDALWVANSADGTVTRIDPAHAQIVRTIPVGVRPVALATGEGQVWVADAARNAVIRINPATDSIEAKIIVGSEPLSIAAGNEGVWTANAGDGTLSLIDQHHDRLRDTILVGGRPVHISLSAGGAWVADAARKWIIRINRSNRTISAHIDVDGQPGWVQAFDHWDTFVALAEPSRIVRIDPATDRVFGPPLAAVAGPRSMLYYKGAIWFADSAGTTLSNVNLNPFGQHVGGRH